MSESVIHKWFLESLREDQRNDYLHAYSINQQKDWYIRYLEDHYCSKENTKWKKEKK